MYDEQEDRLEAHWSDHVFGIIGLLWIAAVLYILWGMVKEIWLEWKKKSELQPIEISNPGGESKSIWKAGDRS